MRVYPVTCVLSAIGRQQVQFGVVLLHGQLDNAPHCYNVSSVRPAASSLRAYKPTISLFV